MRQKRAKTYRKLLASYVRHFGLRPPLQILIDASMAQTLADMKVSEDEVFTRLESVLQVSAALPSSSRPQQVYSAGGATNAQQHQKNKAASYVKPMITQCCITELYKEQKNGEAEARAVTLAKNWERRYCNHKEPLSGDRCIRDVIGDKNKHRYVLAANSHDLRNALRHTVPGVAVVHVNEHKVLVMEPMSDLTRRVCDEREKEKLKSSNGVLGKRASDGTPLANVVDGSSLSVEASLDSSATTQAPPVKRKKKAKEPNPLSMKKSKKELAKEAAAAAAKKKKRKPKKKATGSGDIAS